MAIPLSTLYVLPVPPLRPAPTHCLRKDLQSGRRGEGCNVGLLKWPYAMGNSAPAPCNTVWPLHADRVSIEHRTESVLLRPLHPSHCFFPTANVCWSYSTLCACSLREHKVGSRNGTGLFLAPWSMRPPMCPKYTSALDRKVGEENPGCCTPLTGF